VSDNTTLNSGTGGDSIRDKDRSGVKTQVVGVDTNIGGGSEVLQTASALADATSNPTVPSYATFLHGYNATNWDRLRTVGTGILKSDFSTIAATTVDTNSGNKSAGTQRVVVATDQPAYPIKIDQTTVGTTNAVSLAQVGTVTVAIGNGVSGGGVQRVAVVSDNTPFPIKIDQTTPGTTNKVSIGTDGTVTFTGVNAFPAGFMRTSDEPRVLLCDPFDGGTLDATRWSGDSSVLGGSSPTVANGIMSIASGTAANGYGYLVSNPTFLPPNPAWLCTSFDLSTNDVVVGVTNGVRFWGHGLTGGTPTSTNPLGPTGDGFGFEINASGAFQAVVYRGGTRDAIATLTAPTDGLYHRYTIYYRADRIYWYQDGLAAAQLGATSSYNVPVIETLPVFLIAVAHSTPPVSTRELYCKGISVADTGKNASQISDGTYPWRKLAISSTGTVGVTQATITKGTQGSTGITTQDLKDSGRNARAFMLDTYTAAPVAEALQSVVQWYGNAAVGGTSTPAVVPAGKTLRLTSWAMSTKSLATVGSAVLRIRANTGGTVVIGSPLVWSAEVGSKAGATTTAMTGALDQQTGVFPEGFEFPAGTGLGFTLAGYGPTGTLTLEGVTRFAVYGYEY
jgi:hypothetical protein